jgi:hypothetical protein
LLVFQAEAEAIPTQPAPDYHAEPLPSPAAPPAERESKGNRCLLWGCGCLILLGFLLAVLALVGMLVFAREIQPIFDELGIPIQLTMLYVRPLLA